MKNLVVRTLSGLVLVVVMLGCILYSQWSFGALLFVLLVGGMLEFYGLARKHGNEPQTVVGIVGGDGIGPIIVNEAARVLEVLLADEIARGALELRPIDGLTIENRLARGEAVPAEALAAIQGCDVLLKGPTATPKGGTLESANVTLRRALDLYANVRPVRIPEENVD